MLSISSISFKAIIKSASNHRALHLSLMEKLGLSRRSYFIHVVNYSQYRNARRGSGARTNQYQRNIAMLSLDNFARPPTQVNSPPCFLLAVFTHKLIIGAISTRHNNPGEGYQVVDGHYIMGPGDHPIATGLTMRPELRADLNTIAQRKFFQPRLGTKDGKPVISRQKNIGLAIKF